MPIDRKETCAESNTPPLSITRMETALHRKQQLKSTLHHMEGPTHPSLDQATVLCRKQQRVVRGQQWRGISRTLFGDEKAFALLFFLLISFLFLISTGRLATHSCTEMFFFGEGRQKSEVRYRPHKQLGGGEQNPKLK